MDAVAIIHSFVAQVPGLLPDEAAAIADSLEMATYPRGTQLVGAGQVAGLCYYVLQGCVRAYVVQDGVEKTTAFYTEQDAVVDYASYLDEVPVQHYWVCVEDTLAIVGSRTREQHMYARFPKLEAITRRMMEADFARMQQAMAAFMTSTPAQRYQRLMAERPGLLQRVPQHQLASYLGVTPESLSRIRRRVAGR